MNPVYSFKVYSSVAQLPESWNTLAAKNIFLHSDYLEVLEKSAPSNMICHFVAVFDGYELVAIALSQFLDLTKLNSFGERDRCLKSAVRNFVFRNFSSQVLFIGNNMLTGQNAFVLSGRADWKMTIKTLRLATEHLKITLRQKGIKVHIVTFKDFNEADAETFRIPEFANFYKFSTQPNMILKIDESWKSESDYIDALLKKIPRPIQTGA